MRVPRISYLTWASWLLVFGSVLHAQNAPVQYVYDDAGRLVAVVDQNGNAAQYVYDSVGNLLQILRFTGSQVTIVQVSPSGGAVGASITIYGTGFSTVPTENTVTFDGVAAIVTSATATQLVVTVPSGATTGSLAVTTPSGSASTTSPFSVTTGTPAPTITGVTPNIGAIGTPVTISGSAFDATAANDRVTFNVGYASVGSASAGQLLSAVPPGGTSGKVTVTTPFGTATSAEDFFVPPPPYTASDVAVSDRVALDTDKTITIGSSQKIGLVLFDLPVGHRASVKLSGVSIYITTVSTRDPYGRTVKSATIGGAGGLVEPVVSPISATNTIVIDPSSSYTGSLTLHVYDVPDDITGTITPDGSTVTVPIAVPGQNGRLTFAGMPGQRVSLKIGAGSFGTVRILNPDDGTTLASASIGNLTQFIEPQTLPVTGTYPVTIDPSGAGTGNVALTLYDVPPDVTGTIPADGSPVTVPITTPGQNGMLTFSGTAGQRISLKSVAPGVDGSVRILNPDGSQLASGNLRGTQFIDVRTLSTTGTYSVVVDPSGAATGNVTLTLYDVPPDITGPIATDGSPLTVTISTPGQKARLTFSGTTGQRISLKSVAPGVDGSVRIIKPDGSQLVSGNLSGTQFIDVRTLAATGTYAILIDPSGADAGNVTLNLYDVPPDVTGVMTADGTPLSVTITAPGQNARLTFDGTAGQQVTVHVTGNTIGTVSVKLLDPGGMQLKSTVSNFSSFSLSTQTLPASGSYTVVIDPSGTAVGSLSVSVTTP